MPSSPKWSKTLFLRILRTKIMTYSTKYRPTSSCDPPATISRPNKRRLWNDMSKRKMTSLNSYLVMSKSQCRLLIFRAFSSKMATLAIRGTYLIRHLAPSSWYQHCHRLRRKEIHLHHQGWLLVTPLHTTLTLLIYLAKPRPPTKTFIAAPTRTLWFKTTLVLVLLAKKCLWWRRSAFVWSRSINKSSGPYNYNN